jgi:hypothetical protein
MTLTPAQQIALDQLREAFDEATVARMVRAVESDIEHACVAAAFLFSGPGLLQHDGAMSYVFSIPAAARAAILRAAESIVDP